MRGLELMLGLHLCTHNYVDVIGTRGTYICRIRYLGRQAVRNPLVPLVVDLSLAPVLGACPQKPELTVAITLQPWCTLPNVLVR